MNSSADFFSISWKDKATSKLNSVFVNSRLRAIDLFLRVRRKNKNAELCFFPKDSGAVKVFGGAK